MTDHLAAPTAADAVERRSLASDARLVRDVRWRLVAWSGGSTLIVLILLGLALYLTAAGSLERAGVAVLEQRAGSLRDRILGPRGGPGDDEIGFMVGGASSGTFALVVNQSGRPTLPAQGRVPSGLPDPGGIAEASATGRSVRLTVLSDLPVRILTERVATRQGPVFVQVVQDRTAEQRTLQVILVVLVLGGLVAVGVAVAFGALYGRRALVPINESLAAQRLSLRRQREFAADASHELRTPLTVIRSNLDHLRRNREARVGSVGDVIEDIDAEVSHLTALVEDLLVLARSDSGGVSLEMTPVDLGEVAVAGASSLNRPAAAHEVRVTVDPEPAVVVGDAVRLRQLVTILTDNAIRHSPRGGEVRVRVRAAGDDATIEVEDDGPGISPEHLPRVFDRFWRAPGTSTEGTGLGLAIAAWIVTGHGGRIAAANRPEGGARFSVQLPASGPAPS